MKIRYFSPLLLLPIFMVEIECHGRLMDPPARNAMWRLGYPNPVNYNDNELYCGGFAVQYNEENKGQCGVCGDEFSKTPRDHETGGYFANSIIGKRYVSGQVIDIEAELTTNHWGSMQIKLCPRDDDKETITQQCLDQHVLELVGKKVENKTHFIIPKNSKKVVTFKWQVKLPDGITCAHCVVQWRYRTGNTWGFDKVTGQGANGLGPQETFINCADVYIIANTQSYPSKESNDNPWLLYYRGEFPGLQRTEKPLENGLIPLILKSNLCIPIGEYENDEKMKNWCRENCMKYPPNCPQDTCKCVHECKAIGEFAKKNRDPDIFCHQNCLGHPSHCPKDKCKCF